MILACCVYTCVVSVGLLFVYWCCCIVWFGVLLVVVGAWFWLVVSWLGSCSCVCGLGLIGFVGLVVWFGFPGTCCFYVLV